MDDRTSASLYASSPEVMSDPSGDMNKWMIENNIRFDVASKDEVKEKIEQN